MEDLQEIRAWVQAELKSSVNFWLTKGMDKVHGGIYTSLDRFGHVFSKDKSVWMQGRTAWTYAELCRVYGRRPEWENFSKAA
jgi:N-acylglucosamine 2-epimerase